MKLSNLIAIFSLSALTLTACEKSQDFLRDNTTPTGVGYAPVSNNTLQDVTANPIKNLGAASSSATVYAKGTTFKTELTYFSQDPIKEINLYNTIGSTPKAKVATIPYQASFSQNKRLDTLLVSYTIPDVASGTVIRLDYEILNVNTLNAVRTAYVKVQ